MDIATLEQAVNNAEAVEKIYNSLQALERGSSSLHEAYEAILETVVLDVLKIK